jgi:hypothetical protein
VAPNEEVNMIFGEIVNNCLVDVWQKTLLEISDHEEELFDEPTISSMPQGMTVQYIPQGLIIFFGKQEDLDGNW